MQTINFTDLTPDEANIVLAGLGELPAKISMALIIKLKQQGDAQMQPPAQPVQPAPKQEVLDADD